MSKCTRNVCPGKEYAKDSKYLKLKPKNRISKTAAENCVKSRIPAIGVT